MSEASRDDERPVETGATQAESKNLAEHVLAVLQALRVYVTCMSPDYEIRYINRSDNFAIADLIGTHALDYISPEYREHARSCFERVQASGEASTGEWAAGASDQARFHYINLLLPEPEPDGRVGLCMISIDISERHRHEEALQASREHLRMVTDVSGMALWDWDMRTGKATWDERMHEITGQPEPLDFEAYLERCVHPDDRKATRANARRAAELGSFSGHVARLVRPDGEVRWTVTSGLLHIDDDGNPTRTIGSTVDITEQRVAEQQLLHAQKLQAVGNLTAGVAHNFNNMLMIVQPALELLAEFVPAGERRMLDNAELATERAAEMIRQLMAFAGQRSSRQHDEQALGPIVAESVRMARQTFGKIRLRFHEDDNPRVRCDAGAIAQVVMNILLNARDAVHGTDDPSIEVFVARTRRVHPRVPELGPGSFASVHVRDNGSGMDASVRAQIFEPFFTTKLPEGTGLGLSTSFAIVREHGGWIECESHPGVGTSMWVWLPTSRIEAPKVAPATRSRILLIDDDADVREVVSVALADAYDVVARASVAEAEVLLDDDAAFDLALVDQSMPGGHGRTLLPTLRRRMPRARVFYFTGLNVERPEEVDGVIQKPVTARQLRAVIADALVEDG